MTVSGGRVNGEGGELGLHEEGGWTCVWAGAGEAGRLR